MSPTRREKTVLSCRCRRCELGIRDMASCEIDVNGRTDNRRTTERLNASAVYCWRGGIKLSPMFEGWKSFRTLKDSHLRCITSSYTSVTIIILRCLMPRCRDFAPVLSVITSPFRTVRNRPPASLPICPAGIGYRKPVVDMVTIWGFL